MKNQVLLGLLLFMSSSLFAQVDFDTYFREGSMRYDFEFTGDYKSVDIVPAQIKINPYWGGNPNNLIEDLNLGNYTFQLKDIKTGKLIFQRGFCPLFWEWQATEQAHETMRSFYQGLFFPVPKKDVLLVLNTRDENNGWTPIYTNTIHVDNYFIKREVPLAYDVDTIFCSGNTANKIDLVILSEGYTNDEMPKYIADSKRLIDCLFSAEPFCKYKDRFNVMAVKVPSLESGTDMPQKHLFKNTAFNSHFYTFSSPRYLTVTEMKPIYDALDFIAWDHIYVLVNTERYGGGGFYNFMNLCSADNERSHLVFIHEFGHGFGGLGDEYAYDTPGGLTPQICEPWEPNLTALIDFESKWKHLVDKNVPIPTPDDEKYYNKVGAFEGGGYVQKGIYRPMNNCWMNKLNAGGFCPVCQEAIERAILEQTR